jgi:ankyrin repeat protein
MYTNGCIKYDFYDLLIISPHQKALMIMTEILQDEPDLDIIRTLIDMHANLDWMYDNIFTPLHYSAFNNKPEITKILIDSGANVNIKNEKDMTPLHIASLKNSSDICKMLLRAGADKNSKDSGGYIPLHWAIKACNIDIVNLLLDYEADPNIKGDYGYYYRDLYLIFKNIIMKIYYLIIFNLCLFKKSLGPRSSIIVYFCISINFA